MSYQIEYLDPCTADVEIADGAYDKINSYARVLSFADNTVKIDTETLIEGKHGGFTAGEIVMLHVSATNRTSAEHLGKYLIAKILLVASDGTLTLDKTVDFAGVNLDYETVQAIVFGRFSCLKLKSGAIITPPPFNPWTGTGGICAISCYDDFILDGGHILLEECGIPYGRKNALRPLTTQETAANGESDFALLSGQENFITSERFLLNAGDGACFIVAKNFICSESSRIGNINTHGAQFCRGHSSSVGVKPANITNIGGSSIFIAADKIENFSPKIIAKYRSSELPAGKGLCRCYIASNSNLRTDEGLYAKDILSNPARVRELGIENFGTGSYGDLTNPAAPLNNYAKVTAISQGGYRFNFADKTLSGLAPLRVGTLTIALATQLSNKYTEDAGKFVVGRIIAATAYSVTLDKPLNVDLNNYAVQLISVPELDNLTVSNYYTSSPKYEDGKGGVFAVAVADKMDISGGKIIVQGGAPAYGYNGLAHIGNAQNFNRLPIGQGLGSIFILARELIMNENSRLGAPWSGAGMGGRFGGNNIDGTNFGGGYSGAEDENGTGSGGGFMGGGASSQGVQGKLGGSGASGGATATGGALDRTKIEGGYGSSGTTPAAGRQGAHLMIIADKITNFTRAAISTGGEGGHGAQHGAASYGGGGGLTAGGSGGFAFIYTNN